MVKIVFVSTSEHVFLSAVLEATEYEVMNPLLSSSVS